MRVIRHYIELESFLDNVLVCTMCQDMINTSLLITPCFHMFCLNCFNNRYENKDKCPECHQVIKKEYYPIRVVDNVVAKFRDKRKAINDILKLDAIKRNF